MPMDNFKSMMLGSGASGKIFYSMLWHNCLLVFRFYLLRLEPADAVFSHVQLESCGAIATGPNMSGKSTLMRALGSGVWSWEKLAGFTKNKMYIFYS